VSGTDNDSTPSGIEPEPRISRSGPPAAPGFHTPRRAEPDERPPVVAPPSDPRRWAALGIIAALIVVVGLVVFGASKVLAVLGSNEGAPWSQSPIEPADSVEETLQATIDRYSGARDNGALWKRIDDTPHNRTAVSAFLYLLTDMKLAASFGGDTTDYLDRADELEQKLLNEEPLGTDIEIILSDRVFTYDGETGEGGYTAK
jgi:hypothetical protein